MRFADADIVAVICVRIQALTRPHTHLNSTTSKRYWMTLAAHLVLILWAPSQSSIKIHGNTEKIRLESHRHNWTDFGLQILQTGVLVLDHEL